MDDFFTKTKCDRCGGSLENGRIMSMYNEECLCSKCKDEETHRADYQDAVKLENERFKEKLKFTCCICGKESHGFAHNPYPLKRDERCCDDCNKKITEERLLYTRLAQNYISIIKNRSLNNVMIFLK